MIELMIISVGELKENYLIEMVNEYKKRISKYAQIELKTLKDESNKENENVVKVIEGKRILESIKGGYYVVLLDLRGKMLDSIEFSQKIDDILTYNSSKIAFIIGGSLGVSDEVYKRADFLISFSKMTFPHQLMKGILLEQIYRSFKILHHEAYHK